MGTTSHAVAAIRECGILSKRKEQKKHVEYNTTRWVRKLEQELGIRKSGRKQRKRNF